MRLAFRVSYIGTDFAGSQQQPGERTVCGEIINAIRGLNLISDAADDACARFQFSGRTDRGVSARHQIAAFDTEFPERAISKPPRHAHGDLTNLALHERLHEFLIVPREETHTGAAARGNT